MKKTIITIFVIVIIIIISIFIFKNKTEQIKNDTLPQDYKNATYIIEGEKITLNNGLSETKPIPDSATKIITRHFGNEIFHDLNNDGREDVVFLLTQQTGGSGTFYYVVAALNTKDGYIGSEGYFLGDRIAPQTTEIDENKTVEGRQRDNVIVVNYADRAEGESFDVSPSMGKSVWLKLDPNTMQFGVVVVDFEGEI